MCFETVCIMALQGHPRSLILEPIESAYATSCSSSIVTLVLSCPVWEILQVFCWKQHPTPIPPEFWGCSHFSDFTRLSMLRLRGAKTLSYLNIYANYTTTSRTDRRTDGRTTCDSNTALALRASRGKKSCFHHGQTVIWVIGKAKWSVHVFW